MRITIILLMLTLSCSSAKDYSEIKTHDVYIGYKKDFNHKLTLRENGEYLYNHTASWHRYFSYGNWEKRNDTILLIPKVREDFDKVGESFSQGR
jgi:hypothetical protein